MIEGFLERIDGTTIEGWCYDRNCPTRHMMIELKLGGRVLGSVVANEFRQDLANAAIGGGDHGFQFELDRALDETEGSRLIAYALDADGEGSILPRLAPPVDVPRDDSVPGVRTGLVDRRIPSCILHIGMEKTGSTSLQHFMALNRDRLLLQGVLVPRSLAPHAAQSVLNHIALASYALDADSSYGGLRAEFGLTAPEHVEAHRADVTAALMHEINTEGHDCHTLLLSSEHCQSRLIQEREVTRLRNFLMSFCDDIQIVMYLRPQHEVAVSAHGTIIKNGALYAPFFPQLTDDSNLELNRLLDFSFDYDALVTRWENVFGADHVDVRLYQGEILTDFFAKARVDVTDFTPLDRPRNPSLTPIAERVLVDFNRRLATMEGSASQRLRELIIEAMEATCKGTGSMPSRAEAQDFQQRFAETNERLRSHRFQDRAGLFADDFSRYDDGGPANAPASHDAIIEIMLMLLEYFGMREY